MQSTKSKLLSSTMVPLVMMAGVAVVGAAVASQVAVRPAYAACNPCAAKNPCNPCAAAKCNPCAAAKCNPCAAKCNPCAAGTCNPCNPCAAGGGSASLKCAVPRLRTAALCNPCAAKACNPCNPCAAKACNPCNPCAAKTCNPCNPCAAKACNPCNPCAAKACNPCNPCAAANPCNPCGGCNPCAAGGGVELTNAEAAATYDCLRPMMKAAYAKSDNRIAVSYASWRRYSKRAYESATHGGRYVQNYANDKARAYGLYEKSGKFPAGAQLAKDSFSVKANGKVSLGPLFVMEKMHTGFSKESDDWRYTMIMPNGSIFGTTKGKGAAKVQFCIGCHQTVTPEQDSVMLLPQEYRVGR